MFNFGKVFFSLDFCQLMVGNIFIAAVLWKGLRAWAPLVQWAQGWLSCSESSHAAADGTALP